MDDDWIERRKPLSPLDHHYNSSYLAHSFLSLSIKPPAVVRHLAFLYPQETSQAASAESSGVSTFYYEGIPARQKGFEQIRDIIAPFSAGFEPSDREKFSKEFDDAFHKSESFVWNISRYSGSRYLGLEIRLLVDFHSEYATFTIVLDNERRLSPEFKNAIPSGLRFDSGKAVGKRRQPPYLFPADSVGHQETNVFDELTGENAAAWWRTELMRKGLSPNDSEPDKEKQKSTPIQEDVDLIYFGIWSFFEEKFGLITALQKIIASEQDPTRLRLFADFRGFITCPRGFPLASQSRFGPAGISLTNSLQDVTAYISKFPRFPLAVLGLDDDGKPTSRLASDSRIEPNAILCRMLNGSAIYGSTLSSRMSLPNNRLEQLDRGLIPVRYFVLYGGDNQHQIGRLIRRLHSLGELRHAALQDHLEITEIGRELQRLGSRIAEASDACTVNPKRFDRKTVERITRDYVRIGRSVHGGLNYRTRRSKYYQDIIYGNIGDLYCVEMSGWQSYPGFMRRNFDSKFKTIVSVGERYRDIGLRLDRLITISDTARQYNFARVPAQIATFTFLGGLATFLLTHGHQIEHVTGIRSIFVDGIAACLVLSLVMLLLLVWIQAFGYRFSELWFKIIDAL